MHSLTFTSLELAVKLEKHIHCSDTISMYVHSGLQRAKSLSTCQQTKLAHLRVVDTLTDTMCDDCLSINWREGCYAWIKRLMPLLYELLPSQHYWQRVDELKLLHEYFLKDKSPALSDTIRIVASNWQSSSNKHQQ